MTIRRCHQEHTLLQAIARVNRVFDEKKTYGLIVGYWDEPKKELASLLEEQLGPQVAIVDWVHKDDVQREMRRLIKRQLKAAGFSADKIDPTAESIVDLLRRRRGA